ncbi:FecR domain-containing protein [Blastopirellula sp. J2-11]|uniref:FecR domain-containing protein n=1 Tax=Blastopirellula sp. J2-11 TaxID=2943192 RepID=UPI0021C65361|nr:FecR domain-containing protein [Blastopirellula sp. J2-11]UUO06440.1 FecR domain-containing protein [Blastopirellula sp. J2-11]
MSHPDLHRILPLVEASLAGQLTPQQKDDLENALAESEEVRIAYLQAMSMHLDLDQLSRTDEDVPTTTNIAHRLSQPSPQRGKRRFIAASLAACLLAGLFGVYFFTLKANESQISTPLGQVEDTSPVIVEVASAVIFGEGGAPSPGQRITIGRKYILTQGYLAIRFHSGARAVLQAPSVFSAMGKENLLVRSGQCSVFAPPGAEGFQLQSPSAEIVDLGTRFVVNVAETGETQLSVIEGEATMSALENPQSKPIMHLHVGDAAQVDPGSPPRRLKAASGSLAYREKLPDRVVSYEATMIDSLANELLSITIQRDGVIGVYERKDLVRAGVVEFSGRIDAATFCTRMGDSLPEGKARLSLLDGDFSLVTGIINPVSSETQPVCMAVEFEEPIINAPGPDIVLFDLQLLVYDPDGDKVHLRSGDDRLLRPELMIEKFDIGLNSPSALDLLPHCTYLSLERTTSVDDLVNKQFMHGRQVNIDSRALAVGVDLSSLGYQEGESLKRLEFLHPTNGVDPVLIVGLRSLNP